MGGAGDGVVSIRWGREGSARGRRGVSEGEEEGERERRKAKVESWTRAGERGEEDEA